jgi:hypothetical protein
MTTRRKRKGRRKRMNPIIAYPLTFFMLLAAVLVVASILVGF